MTQRTITVYVEVPHCDDSDGNLTVQVGTTTQQCRGVTADASVHWRHGGPQLERQVNVSVLHPPPPPAPLGCTMKTVPVTMCGFHSECDKAKQSKANGPPASTKLLPTRYLVLLQVCVLKFLCPSSWRSPPAPGRSFHRIFSLAVTVIRVIKIYSLRLRPCFRRPGASNASRSEYPPGP